MGFMKKIINRNGDEAYDPFSGVKNKVGPAVVTIDITHPRNFGFDLALSSQATGFVVDKKQGIICSNKHVVHEGPCRAKAKFFKNEEIDLIPIYRDPVHDFGFFKFNPAHLKDTKSVQIELDPDGAKTGRNALMIGNNAGENLSFVPTIVSRTDRGAMPLHDMNTFYVVASDTSVGGSSGAPLLSPNGKAIAMMSAGNDDGNISMYLPLHRVARALEFIREKKPVPRGTIQIGFKYQVFEALLKRKAITEETITKAKKADKKSEGLLVVDKSLPKGPGKLAGLQNGDVLLELNGNAVFNFVQLESVLDTFIGKEVTLRVRREGQEIELKPKVQDQNDIQVASFVEVSDGIFHATQYYVAAHYNVPIEGVFVAKRGYMFSSVPFASVIKRIGDVDIFTIEDFIGTVQELTNGELVAVKYQPISDLNKFELTTITVDKRWFPFEVAVRNDETGKWDYKDMNIEKKKKTAQITDKLDIKSEPGDAIGNELSKYASAIVKIEYSVPFSIDGHYGSNTSYTVGIVVDKELGLVVAPSNMIYTTLIDIQLVFERSKKIHAKVLFVNPETPISVLQFDPALIESDPTVHLESVKFGAEKPQIGDTLDYVGISVFYENCIDEVKVVNFRDIDFSGGEPTGHMMGPIPKETIGLNTGGFMLGMFFDQKTKEVKGYNLGGGVSNAQAEIAADVYPIIETVKASLNETLVLPQSVNLLPITTAFIDLSKARVNGLPLSRIYALKKSMTHYQQKLLTVKRRMALTDAKEKLFENDIILSVDGKVVTLIREFYSLVRGKEKVTLEVFREGKVLELEILTKKFSTLGTTRILHFGGLIVENPHPAIFYLSNEEILKEGGVYIAFQYYGSPADTAQSGNADLEEKNEIFGKIVFKVNGESVKDLDEFKKIIVKTKHDEFVRLWAKDIYHGEISIHDIRLDLEYWKTRDMYLDEKKEWISEYVYHDV